MPIEAPSGTLEVENAKFRASSLEATEAVGIGTDSNRDYPLQVFKETAPDIRLSEGSTLSSAARLYSNNSNLYIQTGTDFTAGSSGDVAFQTMGGQSTHMVIKSDGKVGVGTNSPIEKAHIYVDDAASGAQLFIENASTSNRAGLVLKNGVGEGFNIQHTSGNSNAGIIENFSTVNGGINFYAKGDGEYGFRNTDSNTLRMVIKNNGNVGVGAITPQSKFHVDGDVRMKTLSTNSIGEITPVYARGTGYNNTANRLVKIGDTTHVNTALRGLTLTIITASTHAHVSSTSYDTHGSETASNNLATALEAMTDAQIGILTSYDAYEGAMTTNLITACYKLGLTRLAASADDINRHPYAAIFYGPGASTVPGNHALEVMKSDDASGAYATLSTFLIDDSFIGQTLTNALYSGTGDSTAPTVIVDRNANVGIGTTNPQGGLHVYQKTLVLGELSSNPSSSPNGSMYYNTSLKNAVIKIDDSWRILEAFTPAMIRGLVGWYLPENWTGSQWTDASGEGNHAISIEGTINYNATHDGTSVGARSTFPVLYGNTSAIIKFPTAILPSTYTLIYMTRYNGTNKKRILDGQGGINWLSGHWDGLSGVAYHQGWMTTTTDRHGSNWVLGTDQNNLYRSRSEGVTWEQTTSGAGTDGIAQTYAQISVNATSTEKSDWMCGEIIVYNRTLSSEEYNRLENYMQNKYKIY